VAGKSPRPGIGSYSAQLRRKIAQADLISGAIVTDADDAARDESDFTTDVREISCDPLGCDTTEPIEDVVPEMVRRENAGLTQLAQEREPSAVRRRFKRPQ
jgi:hypothetical protein